MLQVLHVLISKYLQKNANKNIQHLYAPISTSLFNILMLLLVTFWIKLEVSCWYENTNI